MPLFKIKLYAVKEFYVEAENELKAIQADAVSDEHDFCGTQVDWEFVEGEAEPLHKQTEAHIREVCAELILS